MGSGRRATRRLILVATLALVATACGGDDATTTTAVATTTTAAGITTTTAPGTTTTEAETEGSAYAAIPDGDLRLLIPYAPGGSSDVAGRLLASEFEKRLGQSVIVENLPEGSGAATMIELKQSPPDGSTVALATGGAAVVTPTVHDVGFTPDDYRPVGTFTATGYVLIVPPDSPYESLEEFVEAAKEEPNNLKMGMPGGTAIQTPILGEFESLTGATFARVPFEGGAGQQAAVLGGQVDGALEAVPAATAPVQSGDVKGLGVTLSQRTDALPDVPTFEEAGYPLSVTGSPFFLAVDSETSDELVAAWEALLEEVVTDPEVLAKFEELNFQINWVPAADTQQIVDNLAAASEEYIEQTD